MPRIVKGEPSSSGANNRNPNREDNYGTQEEAPEEASGGAGGVERRVLRSRYLAVKNLINDKRDDITRVDSDKFNSIIEEVESLHQHVQKPREQVADAEALLDITNTLMTSVKSHCNEGLTPSEFITCLLRDFGEQGGASTSTGEGRSSIDWKKLGLAVPNVLNRTPGCCTMLGPMNTELKQRKVGTYKKHVKPTESSRPEELDETSTEERTETDKNMATMFEILRKNRRIRIEKLVLNRNSFAQTVENLFALSFLVKDGRAEITVDEKGYHLVSPRNAPAANAVASGEVSYSHFIFRFDFKDWKLMMDSIGAGEELMPDRNSANTSCNNNLEPVSSPGEGETHAVPTTPIRKLSRNRGLVMQEQNVVADSPPESDDTAARAAATRKGKRKLR